MPRRKVLLSMEKNIFVRGEVVASCLQGGIKEAEPAFSMAGHPIACGIHVHPGCPGAEQA